MAKTFKRDPYEIVVDNPDFIRLKLRRSADDIPHLSGFNLWETTDEETGIPALLYMLGEVEARHRGRQPWVIPVASEKGKAPQVKGDRLYLADIDVNPETQEYELVQKHKDGKGLITFHTGFVTLNRGVKEHIQDIAGNKRRIGFHGPVPLTFDAAKVVGESIVMTDESKKYYDERIGRIKGVAGVPEKRIVTIEGALGGPILNRQVDGILTLHQLTRDGWAKPVDVTGVQDWEQAYYDEMMKDKAFLAALAEDEKVVKRQRKFRIIKAPSDHPDG